jgi:Peptidase A4 family/RNase_H superfamily
LRVGPYIIARRYTYQHNWAFSRADEKRAFEAFVDFVMARWARFPDLHIYHYAPYEPAALKRLMGRYATREEELDRMLRAKLFVDLYQVVRHGLRAGVESYSIKRLEPLYGLDRDTTLADANAALALLQASIELDDISPISDRIKETVLARPRAADDFPVIRARLEELRWSRAAMPAEPHRLGLGLCPERGCEQTPASIVRRQARKRSGSARCGVTHGDRLNRPRAATRLGSVEENLMRPRDSFPRLSRVASAIVFVFFLARAGAATAQTQFVPAPLSGVKPDLHFSGLEIIDGDNPFNWDGSYGTAPWIQMRFTVPVASEDRAASCTNPLLTPLPFQEMSFWVGFDYNLPDFPQAGISAYYYCPPSGKTIYIPWVEWFPDKAQKISIKEFPVIAGHDITIFFQLTSATSAMAEFLDNTDTNYNIFPTFSSPNGKAVTGGSAEWIIERPLVKYGARKLYPNLPNYGAIAASECFASTNSTYGTPISLNPGGYVYDPPTDQAPKSAKWYALYLEEITKAGKLPVSTVEVPKTTPTRTGDELNFSWH